MRWMLCILLLLPAVALAQERRAPWTTSRVVGTPEPPLPYVGERVFPKLQWRQPLEITRGLGRLFVVERWGRISSFVPKPDAATFDTLIEMRSRKGKPAEATFGFAVDPNVDKNRFVYICYSTVKKGEDATHLSRFTLKSLDPPVADPNSEQILLKFDAGPHNGACLRFGPDGMLYVSTGDAMPASPPDGKKTGQDISDFESSILRIDVSRSDPETGKLYRVPPDNPFVKTPGAKPEVYAFGLRQPWKMAFEPRLQRAVGGRRGLEPVGDDPPRHAGLQRRVVGGPKGPKSSGPTASGDPHRSRARSTATRIRTGRRSREATSTAAAVCPNSKGLTSFATTRTG